MFTIAPPPVFSMAGISCFMDASTPHTLTSNTLAVVGLGRVRRAAPSHSTPALLNATSSRPYLLTTSATNFFTSSSFDTSALTKYPPTSAATFFPSSSRRPLTTTFAPARANARAVSAPMPLVPPVIRTTLPVKSNMNWPAWDVSRGSARWREYRTPRGVLSANREESSPRGGLERGADSTPRAQEGARGKREGSAASTHDTVPTSALLCPRR